MNRDHKVNERGQNLIIFAVLMVVMVALAGLVIDGGFSLSKKRQAQNAADAGALAGAAALCQGQSQAVAEAQAQDYAINRNEASTANVSFGDELITVTTTIPHQTFLMKIFGTDVVTTTATASAGCYVPCDIRGVLPVAWACQPPEGEEGTNECGIFYYDPDHPADTPWYIIMDSQNLNDDFYCKEPDPENPNYGLPADALDCDLNDDGINDVMAGGNRSWLDLSGGGGGAADLKDWIWNGYPFDVHPHTWFSGQTGVENSVFQAVGDITGSIVWLPVFDSYCQGDPVTECPSNVHWDLEPDPPYPGGRDIITYTGAASQVYYHVIQYSAFRITCVFAPGVPKTCSTPGRDLAVAQNPTLHWNSIKTIEGYFLEDYGGSGKCEGPDVGVHTIYLNH
jgi:Putative Flp pilus-assembly TadE/G-like